jgi:hypothetical protein
MSQVILFNLLNGLIVGAFYALMALGLSLILNLSGVINFAHGGFLALGAYFAYSLMPIFGFWGGLLIAPVLTAMLGLALERLLIRRLYGRDPLYSLLLTFGLAFIFQDVLRFIWGAQSVPYQIPGWLASPLSTDFFFLTGYRIFMVLVVAVAVGGLFLILGYTRLGARGQCPAVAQRQFRPRHLSGRARRRPGGRHAGPVADHRRHADHAELRRHHRGRAGQPAGHARRRPFDRRSLGAHHGVFPHRHRGGDLCDDGAGAAGAAQRPVR